MAFTFMVSINNNFQVSLITLLKNLVLSLK